MTSRPFLGQRQPPPRRSLSTTNVIQRPPQHRTLSQQFPSSSPTRRSTDGFADLTFDGTDAAQGRYGTIPRMGGSRLKLEISDTSNHEFIESPKAMTANTPTWRPNVTPHARSQLHFEIPNVSHLSPRAAQDGSNEEPAIKPMPLPIRPGQHAPPSSRKARPIATNTVKKDVRPKPYTLEVPAAAPRFPPNGHVDFFPWTGNHPEDQFSGDIIQKGYFDRANTTQHELGSAKASLFPALKHKSGLQTLSSLFTSVLAARRAHGQITSASTFRPPPRVTVTDTKREMWLKDLANPTISLRRLSRSIPHGIRGKVLLDQSLSKNIPIERAVWLAKCVGANELRSFRRKGVSGTFAMGGEAKWIRDFTVCVEQFVESVIGACGEPDFRDKTNYAIRLAAHFHAEHLLDREHYMDWLVGSLENSPQAKLPLWILITQIYWKDLMQHRKYGRRLSTALMNHFAEAAKSPDQDLLAPLTERLLQLLKSLIKSYPDSFVSPLAWAKHRELIQSEFAKDTSYPQTVFDNIDRRNRRLSLPGKDQESTPQQRLIQLLDTTLSGLPAADLAKRCWKIDEDKYLLVRAVIAWSTSSHRPGNSKIYMGAKICRFWSKNGFDVTSAIIDFADSQHCGSGRNKSAFYHLVSELARSGHFSTAKYIQWLISRGGLQDASDVAPDGPCATRLLAELPTHNISDGISNLHSTLLDRVEFSVDEEEESMRECMSFINNDLPALKTQMDSEMELNHVAVIDDPVASISQLSRSSKSEVGLWLRHKIMIHMQQTAKQQADTWEGAPIKKAVQPTVTATDFDKIRHYLELIDDYSMLADVLKFTVSSNDVEVLASCADTINFHIDALAAIGAVNSLFEILSTRLRILANGQDSLPRTFLASLADLAARIPSQRVSAYQWSQELALFDRRTAANACSPVSDHIAITQIAEVDFFDEMEKILASGNSMDQPTLGRLFERISHHLEMSWDKTAREQKNCGLLLSRLRPFDVEHFDVLISIWLERFLTLPGRPSMMAALGPLVSFGCLSLTSISASCNNVEILARGLANSSVSQELVQLLFCTPSSTIEAMGAEDSYRLRVRQANTCKDSPDEVLSSIRRGIEQACSQKVTPGSPIIPDVVTIVRDPKPFEVLQRYALLQAESVIQTLVLPLLKDENSSGARSITSIVNELLFGRNGEDDDSTEAILKIANDLTLPFCQIKLELMFSGEDSTMTGADDSKLTRLQAFDSAIEAAVNSGRTAWASIVPLLEVSVAQHLRRRSELQFLALIPSPKTIGSYEPSKLDARLEHANNLLRIVDSTAYSVADTETKTSNNTTIAQDILVVLSGVRILLSTNQSMQIKDDVTNKWLPLLLRFITHHTSEFEATKQGHESRAKVILALSAILLELQALDINTPSAKNLTEHVYDLALYLVDALPEDVRQQCIRSLHEAMHKAQMYYLFSFQPSPSEGLVLSQKETLPPVAASGAGEGSGNDQRQFLGNKEKLMPFALRRWEMLGEPTPNVGENDTSLNLTLFGARRG